ncbi:MAG TPA: long-chain fatty acid--CoA ligase [Gemmatimonadales bacterium]|nr:long-chain fatty acid--CoA ligase [Gemmatimonadales bacterium]
MTGSTEKGTLTRLFFDAVERHGRKPLAVACKPAGGTWRSLTHREVLERVARTGLALQRLGIRRGDRVAILSENRPGWLVADFACLAVGAIDVPIYPTLPARQLAYILNDSGAAAIFVSTAPQLAKILEIRPQLPALKHVIAMDEDAQGPDVIGLAEIYRMGAEAEAAGEGRTFRDDALTAAPDDVATIIYTSGTTGDPKGVMLTHDNIWSNVVHALQVLRISETDTCLSFLPLSHIFERMAGHYVMFHAGTAIHYAESIDTVPQNLVEVRPTVVLSVPRLYEKMYARVLENALAGGAVKKRIFFWARAVGDRWADHRLAGEAVPGLLAFQYRIAQRLVFSKLKARTGGRIRFFVSGGAPLPADIAKFFYAAGLPILEGYGLTETSPVICVNLLERPRIGTVGPPIPGVEVQVAEDGEVLTRGRNVMKGYYQKPEATREVLDAAGWFRTGDIGQLDADGCLRLTDRKKDLIVTAGGKNVAPQPIEQLVKKNKYVANAVMLGDRRKFCIMLIVPNFEHLERWAKHKDLAYADHRGLIRMAQVQAKMEREVFRMLPDLASYETPKKVLLLENDFSIDNGDLTPTLKVRRRVVEKKYQRQIDALYQEHAPTMVD